MQSFSYLISFYQSVCDKIRKIIIIRKICVFNQIIPNHKNKIKIFVKMDEVFDTNSSIDPCARQQNIDQVLSILRELTPEEGYIFDREDANSDISQLSDPFVEMAEFHPKAKTKPKVETKVIFCCFQIFQRKFKIMIFRKTIKE